MTDSEDDKDAACHLRNNYSISQYDINNASNTLQYLSDLYRENCLLGAMFLNAVQAGFHGDMVISDSQLVCPGSIPSQGKGQ